MKRGYVHCFSVCTKLIHMPSQTPKFQANRKKLARRSSSRCKIVYIRWCVRAAEQSTRGTQSDYAEERELVAQEWACKDAEYVPRRTLRNGQNERQEPHLNFKVKPKQALGTAATKHEQKQGLCDKTWWICVQLVTNWSWVIFYKSSVKLVTKDQIGDQHWSLNAFGDYLHQFL